MFGGGSPTEILRATPDAPAGDDAPLGLPHDIIDRSDRYGAPRATSDRSARRLPCPLESAPRRGVARGRRMDDARDGRGRCRRVNARARARRRARGERATVNEEEYPVRRLRVMNRAQLAVRENTRNAVSGRRRGRPRARALV